MLCSTIQHLHQLTHANRIELGYIDLIRMACRNCPSIEVCPAVNDEEYSARQRDAETRKKNVQD